MEIRQSHRKCAERIYVGAAMAVLLLMSCAANAESIRVADSEDAGASFLSGMWIEPAATVEAIASSRSLPPQCMKVCPTALCEVWNEPTLHAATWRRAKACGDEGDLRNLHLAPEPSGAVLALLGMMLGWRRLRSKLRG
jgi:hypothetical protein